MIMHKDSRLHRFYIKMAGARGVNYQLLIHACYEISSHKSQKGWLILV